MKEAPRLLVVNADDFGYAGSVNAGIVAAHANGIVTAATWLAGGEAATEAARLTAAHPVLDVGLHLALSEVTPQSSMSDTGPLLENGRFPVDYRGVWRRVRAAPPMLRAVEAEWEAQYAAYKAAFGRPPSHVDSHQHVALLPALQEVFLGLARAHCVPFVRIPEEVRRVSDLAAPPGFRRALPSLVLSRLARRFRRRADALGLRTTEHFAGFRDSGRATLANLIAMACHVRPGTTEWMVHPGATDTRDGCRRAEELAALTDPALKAALEGQGVRLVSFRTLAEMG